MSIASHLTRPAKGLAALSAAALLLVSPSALAQDSHL